MSKGSGTFGYLITLLLVYSIINWTFDHLIADHSNNLKWKANMDGSTTQVAAASATAFNATSDYRLKENIEDLTDGITKVKQLQPKKYNWISDETDTLEDGFIAHEVAEVVPEAVVGEKDGADMQSIDQSKLVPLLVKTIQELEARITALENP